MKKDNNDKIRKAAALKYTPGEDRAPRLVATGKGEAAEKMIEIAKENNIPLYEDENLANFLSKMHPGSEIPKELYEVVAEILVFVSDMDKAYGEKHGYKK